MDIDNEMNAFFNFNEEEEVANDSANIQHLIDQLPISNPLTADQFIQIDNELDHQRIPTDEEIIEMVKHPDEPDGPEEPEEQFSIVKTGEAVHGVDVITNYIRQQNQEFVITHEEFKTLLNIKKKILFHSINAKRQGTLDSFLR